MTTDANNDVSPSPKVRAVAYDERFLNKSWEWLQNAEIRRLTMSPRFTKEQQRAWFARLGERSDYVIWGIEYDGKPVGAFGLKNINDGSAEYWGYIGEKELWGRGIGRWMVEQAVERGRERGVDNVYLKVSQENTRAINLYKRCGFEARKLEDDVVWMDRA